MRSYLIQITMPDGSQGEHHGLYPSGCEAVIFAMGFFPLAKRISARRESK